MYAPCRSFPGEVEDYYCLQCRVPCSALSLLVGTHTNHPRKTLVEALETVPDELAKEAIEYDHCAAVLARSVDVVDQNGRAAIAKLHDDIESVDAEIALLQQKREQLLAAVAQAEKRGDDERAMQSRRVREMRAVGLDLLAAAATLKPFYHCDALLSATFNDNTRTVHTATGIGSLEELAKVERTVHAGLSHLPNLVSVVVDTEPAAVAAAMEGVRAPQQNSFGAGGSACTPERGNARPKSYNYYCNGNQSNLYHQHCCFGIDARTWHGHEVSPSRGAADRDALISRVVRQRREANKSKTEPEEVSDGQDEKRSRGAAPQQESPYFDAESPAADGH